MNGTIIQIYSNWYQSIIRVGKKTAIGFGTTRTQALADSFRDLATIKSLSK